MALIDKQEFVGLDGIAHLATGGEAPWLRSHDDACRRLVLDNALDVLDGLDPKAVLAHAHELGGKLIEGLRRLGLPVITPVAPDERAGNVCFLAADGQGLAARLAERGVLVWGGDGRIRISAHVHDGADDVRRCLDELASISPRR